MKHDDLKKAFSPIPQECYDALMQAANSVEEEPIMKRKLSMALVLALVLILLVGAAFAITQWTQQAEQIAVMEAEKGYYDTWNAEDRIKLVRLLVESGELEEDDNVRLLLSETLDDEAASELATEIITTWGHMREDTVTLISILEHVWGPYSYGWSLEQAAWYTQILADTGRLPEDHERHYMPTEDDLAPEEVIRIAQQGIEAVYGLEAGALDVYTADVDYGFWFGYDFGDDPFWCVTFIAPEGTDLEPSFVFLYVDAKTGKPHTEVLEESLAQRAEWEAHNNDPLIQKIRAFYEETGEYALYWMSLEDKARWSAEIRPLILAREAEEPGFVDGADLLSCRFVYGLPDEDALTEEAAYDIAKKAVQQAYGVPEGILACYSSNHVYYDVTDPDQPRWKFYFNNPPENYETLAAWVGEDKPIPHYRVEIDAMTGEVLAQYIYDQGFGDSNEAYYLRML